MLFKRFAGIDVFAIEVATEDAEELVKFCQLLEPTVGGINLEDISAPACFHVEERLKETLDIPVFHDDQHGNCDHRRGGSPQCARCDQQERGGCARRLQRSGSLRPLERCPLRPPGRRFAPNIVIVDSKGVIYNGRTEGMNEYKARFAADTDARTLAEAMEGADVFVGLSVKGAVTKDMVASMADRPLIFALANPDPEITPEDVAEVRGDAITATGRSDYPNQVNNVLGFPFLFRGALDVRATQINEPMMLAATEALADLAREEVPEAVALAYGGDQFEFGPDYIIPKPFDPRVLWYVAPAVAKAAMETGPARVVIDLDEYRDRLMASLGPGREVMRWMATRARRRPMRVVLADGENESVIRAAAQITDEGVARLTLIGPAFADRTQGAQSRCRHGTVRDRGSPGRRGACRRLRGGSVLPSTAEGADPGRGPRADDALRLLRGDDGQAGPRGRGARRGQIALP